MKRWRKRDGGLGENLQVLRFLGFSEKNGYLKCLV